MGHLLVFLFPLNEYMKRLLIYCQNSNLMLKVRFLLYIICLSSLINVNIERFQIKDLYARYSQPLSNIKSRNGSIILLLIPFTHGHSSWNDFYVHNRTKTMRACVRKMNLFKEKKNCLLLNLIQLLYGVTIYFMMMTKRKKKTLVH